MRGMKSGNENPWRSIQDAPLREEDSLAVAMDNAELEKRTIVCPICGMTALLLHRIQEYYCYKCKTVVAEKK